MWNWSHSEWLLLLFQLIVHKQQRFKSFPWCRKMYSVKEMSKINIIHHTSQDRKVRLWAYAPKDKIVCPLLQFATSWKTFKFLLFEMTGWWWSYMLNVATHKSQYCIMENFWTPENQNFSNHYLWVNSSFSGCPSSGADRYTPCKLERQKTREDVRFEPGIELKRLRAYHPFCTVHFCILEDDSAWRTLNTSPIRNAPNHIC